jgi:hypothetical protein
MQSPSIKKEQSKMSIKNLIGKKMSRNVKFMGEDVKITKLSVAEVLDIQEKAKNLEGNDAEGFNILKSVIRSAVEGGDELSDEDFQGFPMDELSKLSNEIMKFSGLGNEGK